MGALRRNRLRAGAAINARSPATSTKPTACPRGAFKRKVRETARERSVGIEPRHGLVAAAGFSPRGRRRAGAPRPPTRRPRDDGRKPIEPTLNRFLFLRVMRVIVPSGERGSSPDGRRRRRAPNTALTRSRTSHVLPFSAHARVVFLPRARACRWGKKLLGTWKIHPGEQQKWENPLIKTGEHGRRVCTSSTPW